MKKVTLLVVLMTALALAACEQPEEVKPTNHATTYTTVVSGVEDETGQVVNINGYNVPE